MQCINRIKNLKKEEIEIITNRNIIHILVIQIIMYIMEKGPKRNK